METRSIGNLSIFFEPADQDAAEQIAAACAESAAFLGDFWGLSAARSLRVYVTTSWRDLALRWAPPATRAVLACLSPLWWDRFKKVWTFCAGLTQGTKDRPAIGIKPPRLLEQTDKTIGERIFVKEPDVHRRLRHAVCHEMVHAFTIPLHLPMWLNEGVAMVTADRFLQQDTVRQDTLRLLKGRCRRMKPTSYLLLMEMDADAIVHHYARGYWITRFLEATRPAFLRGLLSHRRRARTLHRQIAAELGMSVPEFRRDIDGIVAAYFEQQISHRPSAAPEGGDDE